MKITDVKRYMAIVAGKEYDLNDLLRIRKISLQATSEADAEEYVLNLSKLELEDYSFQAVVACVALTLSDYSELIARMVIPDFVPSLEVFTELFADRGENTEARLSGTALS